jgi:predicted DNA binding CopG/RHH family protein
MAKTIPEFKDDKEIAKFWDTQSLMDFESELEESTDLIFVKPQRKTVSIRLDTKYIKMLKSFAVKKGIGYSPLIRMWLVERIRQELEEKPR